MSRSALDMYFTTYFPVMFTQSTYFTNVVTFVYKRSYRFGLTCFANFDIMPEFKFVFFAYTASWLQKRYSFQQRIHAQRKKMHFSVRSSLWQRPNRWLTPNTNAKNIQMLSSHLFMNQPGILEASAMDTPRAFVQNLAHF